MAARKVSWTVAILGLSRAMVRDRAMRRTILGRLLAVALGMMAVGLWLIGSWLQEDVLRFALWWGACAFVTIMVLIFALYDILAVIREEREKLDE